MEGIQKNLIETKTKNPIFAGTKDIFKPINKTTYKFVKTTSKFIIIQYLPCCI